MKARALGERIGRGKEAEVFASGADVVKLYPRGTGKEAAFREAGILAVVEGQGLPAPRPIAVDCIDGRWGLVMTRAGGVTFARAIELEPQSTVRHVAAAAALQLRVNSSPAVHLPALKARLARNIASAAVLGAQRRNRLLEGLASLPDGDRLCHGDFHLMNVIGSPDDAIAIDWLDACSGVGAADVCRSWLLLARRGAELADAHLEAYCRIADIDREDALRWLPFHAAARIAEGVPHEDDWLIAFADGL